MWPVEAPTQTGRLGLAAKRARPVPDVNPTVRSPGFGPAPGSRPGEWIPPTIKIARSVTVSTPTRLVLVTFRDGFTARMFKQVYRKALLPGEPTEFVLRGGRQVWVKPARPGVYVEA